MSVVMILRGLPDGSTTPFDGQYLKGFDFEAHDGLGEADMTIHQHEAKRFSNGAEAMSFYMTQPKNKPIREDGQPNRPLSSTNWEVTEIGD